MVRLKMVTLTICDVCKVCQAKINIQKTNQFEISLKEDTASQNLQQSKLHWKVPPTINPHLS